MRWWYWIICQLKLISTLSDDPNNPGYIDNNQLVTNSHRPSRNFSQKSWPGQFSRSGVTGALHRVLHVTAWRERDGARSPAPKSRARVSRNARSSGWFGHGHWGRVSGPTQRWDDHWGERRGRQQGRSGDKTVAIRVLEEQELRVIQREKETRSENLIFHQWH